MIVESIFIVAIALAIDITLGDPKNRYHPTVWIGIFIGKIIPLVKNRSQKFEKFYGVLIVIGICSIVGFLISILNYEISLISNEIISTILFILVGSILLKIPITNPTIGNRYMYFAIVSKLELLVGSIVKNENTEPISLSIEIPT